MSANSNTTYARRNITRMREGERQRDRTLPRDILAQIDGKHSRHIRARGLITIITTLTSHDYFLPAVNIQNIHTHTHTQCANNTPRGCLHLCTSAPHTHAHTCLPFAFSPWNRVEHEIKGKYIKCKQLFSQSRTSNRRPLAFLSMQPNMAPTLYLTHFLPLSLSPVCV